MDTSAVACVSTYPIHLLSISNDLIEVMSYTITIPYNMVDYKGDGYTCGGVSTKGGHRGAIMHIDMAEWQ